MYCRTQLPPGHTVLPHSIQPFFALVRTEMSAMIVTEVEQKGAKGSESADFWLKPPVKISFTVHLFRPRLLARTSLGTRRQIRNFA